jgi:LmbE family N-acetylglucosaminyl deacetylase
MGDTCGVPQSVIAIAAHPDDIEILCAGAMALYARAGAEVWLCTLTAGEGGVNDRAPDEIARIRRAESESSAALIGARYACLGLPDGGVLNGDPDMRSRVVDIIRQARPDVVFTHDPDDYHPDHRATSAMVLDACFTAVISNTRTGYPATGSLPAVFYMDTLAGTGFQPEQYVDITAVWTTKRDMLACHVSQLEWMQRQESLDFLEFTETMGQFRGIQCGVRYAEGYRIAHAWQRDTTRRLLP